MKAVKTKVSKVDYFRYLLKVLSNFKPFNTLSNRQIEVLSMLLYYYNIYRGITESERYILVFSKVTKSKIRKSLSMSADSLDYILSQLRKKGMVSKDNKLNKSLLSFEIGESININFEIDEIT